MVKVIAGVVLFFTVYICGTMANRKESSSGSSYQQIMQTEVRRL